MSERPKKYYASCSFGKDSIATILLALEHNEPLHGLIYSEVMFDHSRGISGELPEHIEWVDNVAIPKLEGMGVKVHKLRAERDYMYYFRTALPQGSKYQGKLYGFPIGGMCVINRDCKIKPIKDFLKKEQETHDIIQYVGIAIDEPKRLARLKVGGKTLKMSLLEKYGYTEQMAYDLCKQFGLLSPIYDTGESRNGCFFCPNASYKSFLMFRQQHPDLWGELLELGKTPNLCSYGFKYGATIEEVNKKLDNMEDYERRQLKLF